VCAAFDGHGLLGEQASATASRTLDILSQTLKFSNIVTSPKETMEWLFDELHKAVVEDHKSPPENYTYPGRPGSEPLDFKLVEVGGKLGKAYTCTSADGMPPASIDYGTTAAIAVAFDDTVVVGSLGDAGAVLCHLDEGSQCTGTLLSATHTAKDPAEIARIERDFADKALITHDGYLAPLDDEMGGYEVQLTRSLGHALLGQFGISSKPEVLSLNLRKERAFGLVLCSDGVTDEFQPRDIAERVHSGEKDEVAKSLCQEAQEYCMDTDKIDDCTAVVILVNLPDLGTRCTD
jgi:serine/threonine protein phosphatase PrpC